MSNPLGHDARMIRLTSDRPENDSEETPVEFAARLWLRTAVLAWLCWLVPLALAAVARGLG